MFFVTYLSHLLKRFIILEVVMSAACTFELHSHFVLIKNISPAAIPAIEAMVRQQIQFTMEKKRGRFVRTAARVYAARDRTGSEYRFHINQLEHIYNVLGNNGIRRSRIEVITKPSYTPIPADFTMDPNKKPRDNQVAIINYIVNEGATKIVTLQTGQGKAQPLDSNVLTPNGWLPMRNITVGTEVMTPTGDTTKVTGVYPQSGLKRNRLVVAEDGRRSKACTEHLWRVSHDCITTSDLNTADIGKLLYNKVPCYIPLLTHEKATSKAVRTTELLELPLLPTTMGNLLTQVTGYTEEELGVLKSNKVSVDSISEVYLNLCHENRMSLLKGLYRGQFVKDIIYTVTVYYPQLANDIITLARSLGGISRYVDVSSDGVYKRKYIVETMFPEEPWIRLDRIDELRAAEMQCISVDDPSQLYVTDDFMVTHNTFCGLKGGELIGDRIIIQLLGRYFDKWVGDVQEAYGLDPERVVAIRGAKKLKAFLDNYARDPEGMAFDVLIITAKTIQSYMVEYEQTSFANLPDSIVRPEDIYATLGIGYRIIDEVHQHFHNNFKTDLYTHIPKSLYLSATLNPDDAFVTEMYNLAYPPHLRMDGGKFIKYTHVTSVDYHLKEYNKAQYMSAQGTYSHIAYEEWITKDNTRLKNYLEMIREVYHREFISKRKPGQKALIFASGVEFCERIVAYLAGFYPELTIEKYTSEDDYDKLIDSDTAVSTLGSAGTAVDIINLSFCFMTTALSGSQANIQAVGRLRELVNYKPDNPNFFYLTCIDIAKHRDYKVKKKDILQGRVLSHREVLYDKVV